MVPSTHDQRPQLQEDPSTWSTDRVIEELCYDGTVWKDRPSNASFPNFIYLESVLWENEVDGRLPIDYIPPHITRYGL